MKFDLKRNLLVALLATALTACGGGGGSNPTEAPQQPIVDQPTQPGSPNTPDPEPTPGESPRPNPETPVPNPDTEVPDPEPTPDTPPTPEPEPEVPSPQPPTLPNPSESEVPEPSNPEVPQPPTQPNPGSGGHTPPPVITPPVVAPEEPEPEPSPGENASRLLQLITNPSPPDSRTTRDMPDQYTGDQIHVIYAVAQGEQDRQRDVTSYFTNSINSWNSWLSVETDGRKIKFDIYQDNLDITFIQLPQTDQEYSEFGRNKIDAITNDVRDALGGFASNKKYMVYFEGGRQYDSDYVTCGDTKLFHPVVVQYLLGNPPGAECFNGRDFATNPNLEPRYLDYIMLHELIHSEGAVSTNAPDEIHHHVEVNDPRDIMAYTGSFDGWKKLDVTGTNYFNPNGLPSGVVNFAESRFLTP